ncbi:MAG: hypothetical protein H6651_04400 [Ardenticatenales bacterium]|nr:hypothetical protein [Ardenticatenales bacterium]
MRGRYVGLVLLMLLIFGGWAPAGAQLALSIGAVQGAGESSPFEGQRVTVQGIVTARLRSQNSQGRIFHTLFVQAPDGAGDGDPATSDAIPVFVGENELAVGVGDEVRVTGWVQEFYGLTELNSNASQVLVIRRGQPLPAPIDWPVPAEPAAMEPFEAMRIRYGPARLAGPTHAGCGFALLPADHPHSHSHRHDPEVYDGQLLTVQYADELDCEALPDLKVGDQLGALVGPLNYSFDQWRLLLTDTGSLAVTEGELAEPVRFAPAPPGAIRLISLNLHNYFDDLRDTDHEAEPLVPDEERQRREEKIAAVVGELLGCPTLIAVQELEKAELLAELARALAPACGFTYGVAHQESVDARGIDVALLYDPTRVRLEGVQTRQACGVVETEVVDEAAGCGLGEWPLFSRPPLFVHLQAEGEPLLVIVVHLKSKRGGAVETEPIRRAQAEALLRWRGGENRPVILVGDVNDYRDSAPLGRLTSGDLHNVLGDLPPGQQYTFIFDGYAQLLDAILVSPELQPLITQVAIQHSNADFPARWELDTTPAHRYYAVSDHDIPLLEWRWPVVAEAATATLPLGVVTPSLTPPAAATSIVLPAAATVTPPATMGVTTTISGPTVITASSEPETTTGRSAALWLGAIFCVALLILLVGRKWLIN